MLPPLQKDLGRPGHDMEITRSTKFSVCARLLELMSSHCTAFKKLLADSVFVLAIPMLERVQKHLVADVLFLAL